MARILLADDDQSVRELVKRAIETSGHSVSLAEDGAEAASVFQASPAAFDLIITDFEMPGLDGLELARRALASSAAVRILIMSGYPGSLDQGRALSPNRVGVIAKPFTLDDMRRAIAGVLG